MAFFSEYGEDKWIAENLTLPESGFYIDAGAGHPVNTSNTAFLREKTWNGIAIDIQRFTKWTTPFIQAAISDAPFVSFDYNGTCGRVSEGPEMVAAISLSTVISYFRIEKIDFMSIDLEGQEYNAFQTFNWWKTPATIIIAEYNTLGIGEDFRLRDLLVSSGLYDVVHQTVANLIYVLK